MKIAQTPSIYPLVSLFLDERPGVSIHPFPSEALHFNFIFIFLLFSILGSTLYFIPQLPFICWR